MKNTEQWRPSKFVETPAGLRASRDTAQVAPGSRVSVDAIAPHYEALLRAHASGRLLDLGAGRVPLYGVYRSLTSESVCVDWSGGLHGMLHIDVEADLNLALPFGAAEFDTVLATDVLEHLEEPANLFREASRVLRPGGKLLLGTPFFYWIHEAPRDFGRYTSYMLESLCHRHGLTVLELRATGGSPEILLDMLGRHVAFSSTLALAQATLASWVLKLPGLRPLSAKTARWFPLGFVLAAQRAP